MIDQVRSEVRKIFTTRMWWGMALAVFALGGLIAVLFATLVPGSDTGRGGRLPTLENPQMVTTVYTAGLSISRLLILAVGIMAIGAEYRHKTITSTFLATPKRVQVMGAKVITLIGVGVFYGLVHLLSAVGVGATIVASKGFSPWPDGTLRVMLLSLLVLGCWALIGLGVGILIPNQVAALMIAIGAAWILEPILTLLMQTQSWGGSVSQFLPGQATSAMVSEIAGGGNDQLLSWWAGALVLAAYAAVLAGIGSWRTVRADIT